MKQLFTYLVCFLVIATVTAQDITGKWYGILDAMGTELRIVIELEKEVDSLKGTMTSPDQSSQKIALTTATFREGQLNLTIDKLTASYEGAWQQNGDFHGTFSQMGYKFPLNLSREQIEKESANRPQEPQPPYPYDVEDIIFSNPDAEIRLAGTLTIPKGKGPFHAVVLVSGSGPQNRDEEILGHKPFKVIADHFTRNGIAVLRYDDRGVGMSEGIFAKATTADFADDAAAAVNYLQQREDLDKIGIVGHSEGGMIAPIVAAEDDSVSFIVLMAGPGMKIDQLMQLQFRAAMLQQGMNTENMEKKVASIGRINKIIQQEDDPEKRMTKISAELAESRMPNETDASLKAELATYTTPWWVYFMRYDPTPVLEQVKCPVLAINGDLDYQVPAAPNLEGISNSLKRGGNNNVTVQKFEGLNHLFQTAETGAGSEYAQIEETIAPEVLTTMTKWIKTQVAK